MAFFLITGLPDNPVFAQGSNGFAPQDAEWWHNGEASFGPGGYRRLRNDVCAGERRYRH